MTDIVERLNDSLSAGYSELRKEAALEIECLRAKVEVAEKEQVLTMKLADRLALALNTSNHERDALQAKITEMEQQEPVSWADAFGEPFRKKSEIDGVASPLYALPGAKDK